MSEWGAQVAMDFYRVRESEVLQGAFDYFHFRGGYCWRNNTGAVTVPETATTKRRYIQFSERGAADLIGVHTGHFFGLETKSENGKQRPEQKVWQELIEQHGGTYLLLRPSTYMDQIDAALRELGLLEV